MCHSIKRKTPFKSSIQLRAYKHTGLCTFNYVEGCIDMSFLKKGAAGGCMRHFSTNDTLCAEYCSFDTISQGKCFLVYYQIERKWRCYQITT